MIEGWVANTIHTRSPQLRASTWLVVLAVALILLGFDTENAAQSFSDPLAASIDRIDEGSQLRQGAGLALGVWAVFSLLRSRGNPKLTWRPAVTIPLLAFASIVALSPLWALDPALTARRVGLWALVVVGAYALSKETTPDGLARLTFLVSAVVVGAAVVAQIGFGPINPLDGEWRLAGAYHPVALSWYCCIGALASAYLVLTSSSRRWQYAWALAAFGIALLMTRTRTGIVALAGGLVVLAIFNWPSKRRLLFGASLMAVGLAVFAVVLGGAVGLTWSGAYADIVEVTSLGRADAVTEIATFTGRLPVWEISLGLVEQRPVLGYGYNAFSSPQLLDLFARTAGWVPTSSHSGFVDALLSVGWVGASAFLTLVLMGVKAAFSNSRTDVQFSYSAALLTWLIINLFLESSVFFESNFVSLMITAVFIQLAFPRRREASGSSGNAVSVA